MVNKIIRGSMSPSNSPGSKVTVVAPNGMVLQAPQLPMGVALPDFVPMPQQSQVPQQSYTPPVVCNNGRCNDVNTSLINHARALASGTGFRSLADEMALQETLAAGYPAQRDAASYVDYANLRNGMAAPDTMQRLQQHLALGLSPELAAQNALADYAGARGINTMAMQLLPAQAKASEAESNRRLGVALATGTPYSAPQVDVGGNAYQTGTNGITRMAFDPTGAWKMASYGNTVAGANPNMATEAIIGSYGGALGEANLQQARAQQLAALQANSAMSAAANDMARMQLTANTKLASNALASQERIANMQAIPKAQEQAAKVQDRAVKAQEQQVKKVAATARTMRAAALAGYSLDPFTLSFTQLNSTKVPLQARPNIGIK